MSRDTGKTVEGLEHLKQSIIDILTTPIGSRVMRRDYGSRLFELIDAPVNRETLVDYYAAVAEALDLWEPRIQLQQVDITSAVVGSITLSITGKYLIDGQAVRLDGIVINK
ncbi:GPW/gp25 family protein [Acinetobacter sp. CS-2]|uniref:GPW/gp25 family protein n=2 Tax=unclassified Acinetobacter TaxID=196816 RepID=UPI0015D43C0C|nr:GPW/gp25 family protein [Acinetobacter sp. CS-2]